jgi:hypothetical protein
MSHTEGKLRTDRGLLFDELGMTIGSTLLFSKTGEADAQRLVTCWNEHDDLVKELRDLVELLDDLLTVVDIDQELRQYPAACAARKLLAEKYPEAS